jgi:hypothetical protein
MLYATKNIIRMIKSKGIEWVGMGEKRNAYKILVEKPERKRPPRKQA